MSLIPAFELGLWNAWIFVLVGLFSGFVSWFLIGKKALKIKVVREDGKALDYKIAIIRYIGYFVSFIVFFLGYFWVIWDKEKQGWHDKIAGTFVIEE